MRFVLTMAKLKGYDSRRRLQYREELDKAYPTATAISATRGYF
jgi:hypothetical protein